MNNAHSRYKQYNYKLKLSASDICDSASYAQMVVANLRMGPESTPVVTEEVILNRHYFSIGNDSISKELLNMQIIPLVPSLRETFHGGVWSRFFVLNFGLGPQPPQAISFCTI